MSLVCAQCSRVNPTDAAYCYYDGAALAGRAGGPINAGSAPFPNQFVFPNGLACRNFDQLAMACQQHWPAALDLLKQGYLGSFFGGMGRVDLAQAAQEAAKFPDLDRGLDQLLGKLPTQAIEPPKLQAEPSEINLGQVAIGVDRATELHLANVGMRLLYGTVTSDCKWLTLGEGAGHPEKMFQFGADAVIPVHVRGQHLRAGNKPQEGHLTIDSNGGTLTVTFKADVPISPFEGEMFKGAVTPRQIAEKSKANPKDASPYFERGDIAKWYSANGWPYPVQGPIMPGMGAIQQFFEALGVAKPPKVEVTPKLLDLQGAVGKTMTAQLEVIEVAGKDKRKFVYGWATCDHAWVEIGKSKLTGKSALIPITLRIPSPSPPTLEATINVVGNGSQKIAVPLKVTVAGGKPGVVLKGPEVEAVALEIIDDVVAVQVIEESAPMVTAAPPQVLDIVPEVVAAGPPPGSAAFTQAPGAAPPAPGQDENPFAIASTSIVPAKTAAPPAPGMPLIVGLLIHVIPIVIMCLCLLSMLVRDIFWGPKKLNVEPPGKVGLGPDTGKPQRVKVDIDGPPLVGVIFDEGKVGERAFDSMNFAVHKVDAQGNSEVKLNYYDNGSGNSIIAKIDGKERVFGKDKSWGGGTGGWVKGFEAKGKPTGIYGGSGKERAFLFNEDVLITQIVTIEPGEALPNNKHPLNTCLVRYRIENKHPQASTLVGLRVLMDTCIGNEDGVPFILPGSDKLVDTYKEFNGKDVPDFVQVRQNPDPAGRPGIVLHLNLNLGSDFEMPSRFLLTRYPGLVDRKHERWDVPLDALKKLGEVGGDSCVVIYWEVKKLEPGKVREVGFTYGLGAMHAATKTAGRLSLSVGGALHNGGDLTVMALVSDPNAKTATINLPNYLKLIDEKTRTQKVLIPRIGGDGKQYPGAVTWRVRAVGSGAEDVAVTTDSKLEEKRRVTITPKSLFN